MPRDQDRKSRVSSRHPWWSAIGGASSTRGRLETAREEVGWQDTGSEQGGHGRAVCEGAHSGSCVCGAVICNKARGSKASQEPFILLEMVRPEYVRNGDQGQNSEIF